jgi:hypothetical protein
MPVVATPTSPLEAGGEMFERSKTPFFQTRPSTVRPLSEATEATEMFDTDFEDESETGDVSPKPSFDSADSVRPAKYRTTVEYDTNNKLGRFETKKSNDYFVL